MAFLLIMVATGWVWSRAEERVSRWHSQESAFFRRERERSKRSEEFKSAKKRGFLREQLESDFKAVLVFKLGF